MTDIGVRAFTGAPVEVTTAVPPMADFVAALVPPGQRPHAVRTLHQRLVQIDPREHLYAREDMLVQLAHWVRRGPEIDARPGAVPLEPAPLTRLRVLVDALAVFPAFRERVSRLVQTLLVEQSAQSFFARLGIPGDRGLLTETIDRLSRRLMPQPLDEQDTTQLVARMFPSRADSVWLSSLPRELVYHLIELVRTPVDVVDRRRVTRGESLTSSPTSSRTSALGALPSLPDARISVLPESPSFSVFVPLRIAILEGILLLASRVAAAGLSDEIRARSPSRALRESPFFRLPRTIDALLATPRHDAEEIAIWVDECRQLVTECRDACSAVLSRLESAGVSIDVVYRLELIEQSIRRIELLLGVLVPQEPHELARRAVHLLAALLDERRRERSLTNIVGTNTHLLARKVIERAGQTGEHYITVTRGEYVKMFLSAAGGGVLTAGTAALKFFIGSLHRPPLQDGLLASMNYAGSFMGMQLLGFTLATKQPSMTAAALAGALKSGGADHESLVTTVARLVRSQIAAAAGNVLLVIGASFLVDYYWEATHGAHLIDAEYAQKTMASLHPTQSGTIAFAFLTGIILWLSSLVAGWLENWAVYRRLPEAIAEHRIRRIVGTRVTGWASRFFARNIAGFGGNVAVGAMLGFTPVIGQFIGAPLEVRHVTLSTGSLTFAVCSLGSEALSSPEFQAAALGVIVILALNLTVSFVLAFGIALPARDVSLAQGMRLMLAIAKGFARSPLRFFFPVEPNVGR